MTLKRFFFSFVPAYLSALVMAPVMAFAQEARETAEKIFGQPVPMQMNLQEPVTDIHADVVWFHNMLLIVITAITLLVMGLLLYVMVRFRKSKNPTPSTTTHNTVIEVIWTLVPVLILIVIAIPSFRLLYKHNNVADAEMTIKATGFQWYWGYEYPDHGNFSFMSYMVPDEDLQPGQPRLLQTDTEMVIPVDTKIRLQVTAADVIHSWAMPSLGVKKDAVPGRLNEIWFEVNREGVYYGQCSEICGTGHAFMPITVRVVSKDAFEEWVMQAQDEYADTMPVNATTGFALYQQ